MRARRRSFSTSESRTSIRSIAFRVRRLSRSASFRGDIRNLPRDREIVAQCKMGGRSAKAMDFLKTVGFTNVKNLKGGILEWIDKVDPSQPKY